MTAPTPSATGVGVRRGAAFLALASLVVAGLVADDGLGTPSRSASWVPRPLPEAETQAVVTPPGTISATWYCAEGTSSEGGRADQVISIANAGDEPLEAVVSVLRGAEDPVRHPVQVAPRSRTEVRTADLIALEDPGVIVEVFGPDAAVDHVLRGSGDLEALPCARRPADVWLFAGGRTVKDARDVLALLNPFEDDAIVDMTFFTEDGPVAPEALQAFVVPGRSRVSVPVHEHVLRKQVVAAELVARSGRIVAERSISWDGTTGRRGMSAFAGVNAVADEWTFPEGLVQERVFEDMWILNPGTTDTEVEVQPQLDGEAVVEPVVAAVPARSAISVRLNDVVGAGSGHSVKVTVTGDQGVAVAQQIVSATGATREGYTVSGGITTPASRWVFPAGSADDTTDEWVIVANPSTEPIVAKIAVLAGGVLLVPEGLGEVEVPGLERRALRMGDALKRSDLPVVVSADGKVLAQRGLFQASGISLSPGIRFEEP